MKKENRVNNEKGFTLAELLIVVAIIAVLVAVSIPIFTSQLEKSREATDLANMRAAKAALVTKVLDDDSIGGTAFVYDAAKGVLVLASDATAVGAIAPYGKGTGTGEYNTPAAGQIFYVKYDSTNELPLGAWSTGETKTPPADGAYVSIDAAYTRPASGG